MVLAALVWTELPHISKTGHEALSDISAAGHTQNKNVMDVEPMNESQVVRYFKTFAGLSHPYRPVAEISYDEGRNAGVYYEAKYDSSGMLRELTKHLQQRDREGTFSWSRMFSEIYDYFPSGSLKRRTNIAHDVSTVTEFDDKNPVWGKVSKWLRGLRHEDATRQNSSDDDKFDSLPNRLAKAHDKASEIDEAVLRTMVHGPRDFEARLSSIAAHLSEYSTLIEYIQPSSKPRFSLIEVPRHGEPKVCRGFDPILGRKLEPIVREFDFSKSSVRLTDLHVFPTLPNESGVVLVMPVGTLALGASGFQGIAVLVFSGDAHDRQGHAIASLFKRFAHQFQMTMAMTRQSSPAERDAW